MKPNIAIAFIWISVSVAVCVAILLTGKIAPLWTFLIPALMGGISDEEIE